MEDEVATRSESPGRFANMLQRLCWMLAQVTMPARREAARVWFVALPEDSVADRREWVARCGAVTYRGYSSKSGTGVVVEEVDTEEEPVLPT